MGYRGYSGQNPWYPYLSIWYLNPYACMLLCAYDTALWMSLAQTCVLLLPSRCCGCLQAHYSYAGGPPAAAVGVCTSLLLLLTRHIWCCHCPARFAQGNTVPVALLLSFLAVCPYCVCCSPGICCRHIAVRVAQVHGASAARGGAGCCGGPHQVSRGVGCEEL